MADFRDLAGIVTLPSSAAWRHFGDAIVNKTYRDLRELRADFRRKVNILGLKMTYDVIFFNILGTLLYISCVCVVATRKKCDMNENFECVLVECHSVSDQSRTEWHSTLVSSLWSLFYLYIQDNMDLNGTKTSFNGCPHRKVRRSVLKQLPSWNYFLVSFFLRK